MKRIFRNRRRTGLLSDKSLQRLLSTISSRNFSEVEDSPYAFQIIKNLTSKAGKNAAAEAKAAGLSRIFVRDNQLIQVLVNGKEEVIKDNLYKGSNFYIRPSKVLYVRKK